MQQEPKLVYKMNCLHLPSSQLLETIVSSGVAVAPFLSCLVNLPFIRSEGAAPLTASCSLIESVHRVHVSEVRAMFTSTIGTMHFVVDLRTRAVPSLFGGVDLSY